jgi:hypothetical protein
VGRALGKSLDAALRRVSEGSRDEKRDVAGDELGVVGEGGEVWG